MKDLTKLYGQRQPNFNTVNWCQTSQVNY